MLTSEMRHNAAMYLSDYRRFSRLADKYAKTGMESYATTYRQRAAACLEVYRAFRSVVGAGGMRAYAAQFSRKAKQAEDSDVYRLAAKELRSMARLASRELLIRKVNDMTLYEAITISTSSKAYHTTLERFGRVVERVHKPGQYPYYTLASLDAPNHKAKYRDIEDLVHALRYQVDGWQPA